VVLESGEEVRNVGASSAPCATAQEIQLELIRRSAFNDFEGGHVSDLLLRNRAL